MKRIFLFIGMVTIFSCHQATSPEKERASLESDAKIPYKPVVHVDSICHPKLNVKYYSTIGGMDPSYFIFLNDSVCDLQLYGKQLSAYTFDKQTGTIWFKNSGSNDTLWKVYPGWKLKELIDKVGIYNRDIYGLYKLNENLENPQFGLVSMIYHNGHYIPGGGNSGYEITVRALSSN